MTDIIESTVSEPLPRRGWVQRVLNVLALASISVFFIYFLLPADSGSRPAPHPSSVSNVRQILIAISVYTADNEVWPENLEQIVGYGLDGNAEVLVNPREGFAGYHYEAPEKLYTDSSVDWSAVPIVFEVCEHGGVVRDAGVVGYADGHAVFDVAAHPPSN